MSKLNINIKEGLIEVEGDDSFVKEVYEDFKATLATSREQSIDKLGSALIPKPTEKVKSKTTSNSKKSSGSDTPQILEIDLSPKVGPQSLREFYTEKTPTSAAAKNLLFVYYMQKIAHVSGITLDHIYTCYKMVQAKPPTAFKQSVIDAKDWINKDSYSDLKITMVGESEVEFDMGKKADGK